MKGWIYILSNDAVPDWIAIGCSDSDPEALVRQYGNSGIKLPYPFHLQYALRTPYPKTLLQKIHDELASYCVNPDSNNDWFEYDLLSGIRIIRQIAGNSATGEAFYNQARKLVEQAQIHQPNPPQPSTTTPPPKPRPQSVQIRTVPELQRGKRPSPIAPQIAPPPAPPPQSEPTPEPTPLKQENPKIIAFLIVVWVMLMMVLIFLVAYLFGYI